MVIPALPLSGPRLGLGVLLLGYGVLLYVLIGAVPGGADNSGYFNEARLLAQGRLHVAQRTLAALPDPVAPDYLYVPLGFRPAGGTPRQMVPTYPPGLPLLLVPAAAIAGWPHAGDFALLVHALLGLGLTYVLGRQCGLPERWALVGTLILAASPLYLFLSLQALSDVPATTWATAAVVAALASRRRAAWALAAGFALGVGVLIRPTNALLALPVLVALGASPRRLALLGAGGLPGLITLLALNHGAYGHALESGYGAIGAEFHANLVGPTFRFYGRWLPVLLSPLVLLTPLAFLAGPERRREEVLLVVWAAALILFYSAYRWTHENWWFLRFVLPAAPALAVAGLLAGRALLMPWERRWPALAPLLAALVVLGVEGTRRDRLAEAWLIGHGERKYGRVAAWLEQHVPPNAVLLTSQASGALFYFTDFTLVRYEEVTPALAPRLLAAARAQHSEAYAVLFSWEATALHQGSTHWTRVAAVDDVGIWHADPPRP